MLNLKEYVATLQPYTDELASLWEEEQYDFQTKIIVLDDDPTGVQTVHGVPVFTNWSEQTIQALFDDERQLTFILTNSRAFSKKETVKVHEEIAETFTFFEKGNPKKLSHYSF